MFDHTQLQVWQRAHAFALAVHFALKGRAVVGAPGLGDQLLRASAAIAANLAEGAGQQTSAQCARFVDISIGSATETDNHLRFAEGVGLLSAEVVARLLTELHAIRRMLFGFRRWVISRNR